MTLPAADLALLVSLLEWIFVGYFLILHGGHTLLAAVSTSSLRLRMDSVAVQMLPRLSAGYEIPVSIIVPVTRPNENVGQFIETLFSLDYPQLEVIVVNDTADGATLARLQSTFDLAIFPEAYWRQVRARAVRNVYRSPHLPALRVVDKKPGGPGDAINAGVNAARYPIVCIAQPDCVLKRDSLRRLVPDFLENATTVAAGTAERVANGSFIVNGFMERCRLSGNPLVWIQASAWLHRDLCARHGWAERSATLAFADRLCAFRKDAVIQAGGCARHAANPVLELVSRLHRMYAQNEKRYKVSFLPAPLLWRLMPAGLGALCRAAANEHHGLADALKSNRSLLWGSNTGAVGRLAFPFVKLTEVAGPAIEVSALIFFLAGYALQLISVEHLIAFAVVSIGAGIMVSWLAIFLDAFVFWTYRSAGTYLLLLIAAVFENAGFRQLLALCTLPGIRSRLLDRGDIRDE